jgi:hypothetical protein
LPSFIWAERNKITPSERFSLEITLSCSSD